MTFLIPFLCTDCLFGWATVLDGRCLVHVEVRNLSCVSSVDLFGPARITLLYMLDIDHVFILLLVIYFFAKDDHDQRL